MSQIISHFVFVSWFLNCFRKRKKKLYVFRLTLKYLKENGTGTKRLWRVAEQLFLDENRWMKRTNWKELLCGRTWFKMINLFKRLTHMFFRSESLEIFVFFSCCFVEICSTWTEICKFKSLRWRISTCSNELNDTHSPFNGSREFSLQKKICVFVDSLWKEKATAQRGKRQAI